MKRALALLFLLVGLSNCGVFLPYMYDAQQLDERLAPSMAKDQVLKYMGKPDRVVHDEGQQVIWEYRLYPKGEWAGYLVHCPLFPNCYFPAEPASPYLVVLQDNQLCMWGTPTLVRLLMPTACRDGARSTREDLAKARVRVSVIPVFMPPPIVPLPRRIAIVANREFVDSEINSWLDHIMSFLRTRHRELILVEREDLRTILNEVEIQYGGQVDDDTTIRVGRLVGADSLLTYRLILPEDGQSSSAALEIRVMNVESGTTVFRQMTSVNATSSELTAASRELNKSQRLTRRLIIQEAAAYGFAALAAAFGDNPLGVVPDHAWSGEGIRLIDVLQGGPAFRAGLQAADLVLRFNSQPLQSWTDPISLPGHVTVSREGRSLELSVR